MNQQTRGKHNQDKKSVTANLTVTMRGGGIVIDVAVVMTEVVAVEELIHAPPRERLHQVLRYATSRHRPAVAHHHLTLLFQEGPAAAAAAGATRADLKGLVHESPLVF